ncbi:MAG: M23 family metallopeptidase [Vulcanimicrobiota bacterium]
MRVLLLWLLLSLSAWGDLDALLLQQRRGDPGCYVSSGFYDPRSVSKYRRYPGLHNGYDIAMLAGSAVRAAWPGQVVAVTPWYGDEFGITVRGRDGVEVTYGHLAPAVWPGDRIEPGQVVGRVVVDHVDVKMRDARGAYVDFRTRPYRPPPARVLAAPRPPPDPAVVAERERREHLVELGLVARNQQADDPQKLRRLLEAGLISEREFRQRATFSVGSGPAD